jgi:predicted amidohydrolase
MKFRLAMVQMRVEGGAGAANLDRAVDWIGRAAERGAQVILLPEALDAGWTHPSARSLAEPIPEGEPCRRLCAAARLHGVYVCAGLTEGAGDARYNAAVLINPRGELLWHHRKLNELEIGHACYALGNRLGVTRTTLGTFGVMICADAFARGQVVSRTLGLMGADVILSPCAWAVPANHDNVREPYGQLWRDNYGPVARSFRLWIAGCSNVGPITGGPWAGRKCIGCSLLVGPDGAPVLQGPYGEDAEVLLSAEIEPVPRPAQGDGWEQWWTSEERRGRLNRTVGARTVTSAVNGTPEV